MGVGIASDELRSLEAKRRQWVKATRDNEFEPGIRSLLAGLNSDEAHFVYELLQNAEDAGARRIRFHLDRDCLRVMHDGKRLFSYSDVDSITSIAKSTKAGDVNAIGKFGVGFKAVFSFTDTPRVYSGDYNFEIQDMVCPVEIPPIEKSPDDTVFVFPNIHDSMGNRESALRSIARGLDGLDHTALLFLSTIAAIEWDVLGAERGSIARQEDPNDPSLIRVVTEKQSQREGTVHDEVSYLRVQREIARHQRLKCGLAIRLETQSDSSGEGRPRPSAQTRKRQRMVGIEGKLCVFFPAAKEDTRLKFHLNGPYAASVDRASIPHENEDNKEILRATASLLVDTMEELKGKGLLGTDLLAVLPNDDDTLKPFYTEFRDIVYSSLREKELIPTRDRRFAKAGDVLREADGLASHLSSEDVAFLSGKQERHWAIGGRDRRVNRLLSSIGVESWGFEELLEAVTSKYETYPSSALKDAIGDDAERWLKRRSVDSLRDFYLLVHGAARKLELKVTWPLYRMISTNSGEIVRGGDAYLPGDEDVDRLGLAVVRPSLLNRARKDDRVRLMSFLSEAGVRTVGEREKLSGILDKHYSETSPSVSDDRHKKHIRKFMRWFEAEHDVQLFGDYCFLRGAQGGESRSADSYYVDVPVHCTGLRALYQGPDLCEKTRFPLWKGYAGIDTDMRGFVKFVGELGVLTELKIDPVNITDNPEVEMLTADDRSPRRGRHCIDEDWSIESLEKMLERQEAAVAKLVWLTVSAADSRVLKARYKRNASSDERLASSQLVHRLRSSEWIPASDGRFYRPEAMTVETLAPGFEWDDRNGWLTAIGFGEKEKKATEEYKTHERHASALGFTPEDLALLRALKQNPEAYLRVKQDCARLSLPAAFPARTSADAGRRAERVEDQWNDSPEKAYEQRVRRVRVSADSIDAKSWLRAEYQDENRDVWCQICKQVMPFRGRDGEYYFVAREALDNKALPRMNPQQHLALCPLCDAKFVEFVLQEDAEMGKLRAGILRSSSPKEGAESQPCIDVQFGSDRASIRFTERHLLDLSTLLARSEPGPDG